MMLSLILLSSVEKTMINNFKVEELVEKDHLEKHEEGGYYALTYRSPEIIKVKSYEGEYRPKSTKINYLLEGNDYSAWHRLKSDETWRYKAGTPLILNIIKNDGNLEQIKIGNPITSQGAKFEYTVEKEQWFSAFVNDSNSFSYVECEVVPGFDYRDWELGKEDELLKVYPRLANIITKYSRAYPANSNQEDADKIHSLTM